MSLVCDLDDSGNKADPVSTLAGYIAPAENWPEFEDSARRLFEAVELPNFHTMDLHRRKGEFKDWKREQVTEFSKAFFETLDPHVYAGFAFSVLNSKFEENKPVYNVEHQSSPFGFCLHGIVHRLTSDEGIKDALALQDVNLSLVVESGSKNEGDICRRFNMIKRQDPERFGSISFEAKTKKMALQAADFLAYFSRRLVTRSPANKDYKEEVDFFRATAGKIRCSHFLACNFEG